MISINGQMIAQRISPAIPGSSQRSGWESALSNVPKILRSSTKLYPTLNGVRRMRYLPVCLQNRYTLQTVPLSPFPRSRGAIPLSYGQCCSTRRSSVLYKPGNKRLTFGETGGIALLSVRKETHRKARIPVKIAHPGVFTRFPLAPSDQRAAARVGVRFPPREPSFTPFVPRYPILPENLALVLLSQ